MNKKQSVKDDYDIAFEPYERMGFEPASDAVIAAMLLTLFCIIGILVSVYLLLHYSTYNSTIRLLSTEK